MPEYRRIKIKGGVYFFTLVTYQRHKLFSSPETRTLFLGSIHHVQKLHPFTIDAYCILPDHIHLLISLPEEIANYSMLIGGIKSHFTKQYIKLFDISQPLKKSQIKRREAPIWQRRFWEHYIRDEEDFNRHMNYIHINPVKHGLVTRVCDWASSSFHDHVDEGHYALEWGETYKLEKETAKFGE